MRQISSESDHMRIDAIALVIPYYEGGPSLRKSIETVRLTCDDVIIVVDDGSREFPLSGWCPSMVGDTPVRMVVLPHNVGITAALKAGIAMIPQSMRYVARLDCGDRCEPERFERQRSYLNDHPDCVLVGSWVDFESPLQEYLYTVRYPTSDAEIKRYMRVNSAFAHPATMFRSQAYMASGGYSEEYPAAEDYALFRTMMALGGAANIGAVLVHCQTGDGGISETRRIAQLRSRLKVILELFDWHPMSFYGALRAILQLATPRYFTTKLRRLLAANEGDKAERGELRTRGRG